MPRRGPIITQAAGPATPGSGACPVLRRVLTSRAGMQPPEPVMVTAIVLLTVARGRVSEIAEHLAGLEEIAEVYSVAGR